MSPRAFKMATLPDLDLIFSFMSVALALRARYEMSIVPPKVQWPVSTAPQVKAGLYLHLPVQQNERSHGRSWRFVAQSASPGVDLLGSSIDTVFLTLNDRGEIS